MRLILSIITATYNCASSLVVTARSIRDQTFENIQWIVIDGGSSDGTIRVIEENSDMIYYWVSEDDNGIYDAWNKAVEHIDGDWVQFLGAGDKYKNDQVLKIVAPYLEESSYLHDLVYGSIEIIGEHTGKIIEHVDRPWTDIKGKWEFFRPMLPIHPEVFHNSNIFKDGFRFDTSYKIAGDTHMLLSLIKNREPKYIPVLICQMPLGGVSSNPSNLFQTAEEIKDITCRLGYSPPVQHLIIQNFKLYLRKLVLFFISDDKYKVLMDFKRKLFGKKKRWTL